MPVRNGSRRLGWIGGSAMLALQACSSIGPAVIGRDRIDYTQAVAAAAQREMLLNIVKLRFGDTPSLSSVGQIVAGYSLEGRLDVGTDLLTPEFWFRDDVTLGVGGSFSDRPTITYNLVRGGDYARTLLTPLPPYELVAMLTSGVQAGAALRLAVKSANGMMLGPEPLGASWGGPRGREVLDLIETLRAEGILGVQFEAEGNHRRVSLLVNEVEGRLDPRAGRLLGLLRLDPSRRKFRIVFGFRQEHADEIAIYTRSLIEILNALAAEIPVPAAAVLDGQTYPTRAPVQPLDVPLRIQVQSERPDGAFVAVEYGGAWYAISNGDFASKRVFSLLMFLAAVMETAGRSPLPVITIPSG